MWKWPDFEYHVEKWLKYDRSGYNSSHPSLRSPLDLGNPWRPLATCLQITILGEIGHFQATIYAELRDKLEVLKEPCLHSQDSLLSCQSWLDWLDHWLQSLVWAHIHARIRVWEFPKQVKGFSHQYEIWDEIHDFFFWWKLNNYTPNIQDYLFLTQKMTVYKGMGYTLGDIAWVCIHPPLKLVFKIEPSVIAKVPSHKY